MSKGYKMDLGAIAKAAAKHDTLVAKRFLEAIAKKWAKDAKRSG